MFRYALLYFTLLIIFIVLFVGPSIAGRFISIEDTLGSMLDSTGLLQPTGQDNNDTIGETQTGTGAASYSGALETMSASASASSTSNSGKIRLF